MLISLCIPIMDRLSDLRKTLPQTIRAAAVSPPCEIVVYDYGSHDGGKTIEYLERVCRSAPILYWIADTNDYYHKAKAWNCAGRRAAGDYVVFMGADAILNAGYIKSLRELIADGCVWMRGRKYKGIVCVKRDEFIAAGGYDERFEFSGEDKELDERLQRRGAKFGLVPDGMVRVIHTPNVLKFKHARGGITKAEAIAHGKVLREENAEKGLLVANQGIEWGAWQG